MAKFQLKRAINNAPMTRGQLRVFPGASIVCDMTDAPANHPVDPDLPLLAKARTGDFLAFEALVGRYEQQVYRLARRIVREPHDAEEVVQETFISVLEHLKEFREEASFRSWLLRIATNAALKVLRQRRSHPTVPLQEETEASTPHPEFIAPWQEDPALLADRQEIRELLEEAMQQLDEKHRVVFVLRDMEELSIEETAAALQLSAANVKIRLMRARLMLRELLTRKLGDPNRAAPPHRHEQFL
jgi:RNA polymerase sigma-70 factor, ECF subfamily